jgi:REP element-mobilizing transposase RayT
MPRRNPQLALKLPTPKRWGGRRDGAGRKPGQNPRLRHRSREKFSRVLPAHVTLRLQPGLVSLRTVKLVREVASTFAAGCERSDFRLVHFSLQGNHAHLIIEARDRDALGRGMMALGSRLARAVNRVMGRHGRVLADRYHVRLLPTPREVRNALRYVLLNARHHAAGTARKAARTVGVLLDPASSARWFDGWKRTAPSTFGPAAAATRDRPPVARARTWLLTVGWRRRGLLDPADVPG